MIYAYSRVSTKTQLNNGNSLEEQTQTLLANGADEVVVEQFTGKTTDRPQFNQLIEQIRPGDTLMVTKLDRLARNVPEGIQVIKMLFSRGVKVHVLNVGLLEDTAMGNFFITTLLAVAELERNMILERTLAGKEVARTKDGFREGRPPYSKKKIEYALSLLSDHSYKEVSEITGISKATLCRYKNKLK